MLKGVFPFGNFQTVHKNVSNCLESVFLVHVTVLSIRMALFDILRISFSCDGDFFCCVLSLIFLGNLPLKY